MKVVILTETLSKNMGYLSTMISKYLAKLGVDVHVVTMDLPSYHQFQDVNNMYKSFLSSDLQVAGSVEKFNGYTIHILGHKKVLGFMRMKGLKKKLRDLHPDIVYSIATIGWYALEAAMLKPFLGYKLFTGSHNAASTFPMAKEKRSIWNKKYIKCLLMRYIPGRLVSLLIEKCYAPTEDCAEIAWRFFGAQKKKVEVCYLG